MASAVLDLTSTTHTILVEGEGHGDAAATPTATSASARLAPGAAGGFLEKDFQLLIRTADPHAPRAFLETNPVTKTTACAVTFVPQLTFEDCMCEFVFVVDRSGSMSGAGIASAKSAINLFLRSLPEDCYFNIVGFGSTYETLFKQSVKLSAQSLAAATQHVRTKMHANLGGTEILSPLRAVLAAPSPAAAYARQVFVLTDGQVSNTAEVIKHVGTFRDVRCFALGLGNGCSRDLVDGIARAGRGTADYALQEGNQLERAVIAQLKQAMQPALTDTSVSWDPLVKAAAAKADADAAEHAAEAAAAAAEQAAAMKPSLLSYISPKAAATKAKARAAAAAAVVAPAVRQAPWTVPPIFSGGQFTVFAIFDSSDDAAEAAVTALETISVTSKTPDGPLTVELPITMCSSGSSSGGTLIHALAARAAIQDLDDGRSSYLHREGPLGVRPTPLEVKAEIVRLGTLHGLVSQHTSYVATQPATNAAATNVAVVTAYRSSARSFSGGSSHCRDSGGGMWPSVACSAQSASLSDAAPFRSLASYSIPASAPAPERFRCLSLAGPPPPRALIMANSMVNTARMTREMSIQSSVDRSQSIDLLSSRSESLSMASRSFSKQSKLKKKKGFSLSMFTDLFAGTSAELKLDQPPPQRMAAIECAADELEAASASPRLNKSSSDDDSEDDDDWEDCCSSKGGGGGGGGGIAPMRSSTSTAPPSNGDVLQQLLLLQEFDGAFQLDAALARVVGQPLSELAAAADAFAATLQDRTQAAAAAPPAPLPPPRALSVADARTWFAVAIALAFLRHSLASRKAEWELVEKKSLKWLSKQGTAAGYTTFGATVCKAAAAAISG